MTDAKLTFGEQIKARRKRWVWENDDPKHVKYLTDKLNAKHYMQALGIPVPKLIATMTNRKDIPPLAELPRSYVLKPTNGHGSLKVFPVLNGINTFTGEKITRKYIRETIGKDDKSSYLIEEFLIDSNGNAAHPTAYKFYCFREKVVMLVINTHEQGATYPVKQWVMDPNTWTHVQMHTHENITHAETSIPPKPPRFEEMMAHVTKIGATLNMYMRVDMYSTVNGPVFGEVTPNPNGGDGYSPEADEWLGSLWKGPNG